MQKVLLLVLVLLLIHSAESKGQSGNKGFRFEENTAKQQVDLIYNNQLLTAYCFFDSSRKPMLFPVNTVNGITVTRSYPFQKVPGERTDHPHHTGIWLNYESVNGLDFWNNSTAIPVEKRNHYGTIRHGKIIRKTAAGNNANLVVSASWVTPNGKLLLNEETSFSFTVKGNDFLIDRDTRLTAVDTTVIFKDVKDGMFAIRVARQLELPSNEKSNFVDDKGNVTSVAASDASQVSGMYLGSDGSKGDAVWSTRGPWVILTGKKDGADITIGIVDHPSNVGYPTYWHARGYGLFAANPLGPSVFNKEAKALNYTLSPGKSVRFKYRVVVHTGDPLTSEQMNTMAADFAKKR